MRAADVLKMFSRKSLAKLWKCTPQAVSYKLKHSAVTISEYSLVIKRHPEYAEVLLAALR